MRRIIVIFLLSVFVVALSGCDKIKSELERRHLGGRAENNTHIEATPSTLQEQKTSENTPNAVETSSKRKQIVFRIDLPTDEKIQIRLIKNPEEAESVSPVQSESNVTENKSKAEFETKKQESKDEKQEDKSRKQESSVEEQSMGSIETHLVEQHKKAKEPESSDDQSPSGIKTDREESSPAIKPVSAPTIVVPSSSKMTLPPKTLNRQKELSRQITTEMTPAEKAVESALSITPPETKLPAPKEKSAKTITPQETSSACPWSIPDADYPVQYY